MMVFRQPRARIARIAAAGSLLLATGIAVVQPAAQPSALADTAGTRNVLLVGNAVGGTVSFIDGSTFANLGSFSVIPDLQQVFASWTPVQWANYAIAVADEATVVPSVGGVRYIDD